MRPTDTLYSQQWHLTHLGNLQKIWDEYSGSGVRVGIYDEGVQYIHPDLAANYDPSRHVVVDGVTYDGGIADLGNPGHGTSVAGIIGAALDGTGTVGIAWGASLTGVNVFDPFSRISINAANPEPFYAALAQSANFDVVNNSWGSTPDFRAAQNLNVAGSFAQRVDAVWEEVSATGRGGLGTLIVQSAGNDAQNGNGDGIDASRFGISVAALREDGFVSSYSNQGSNILVSAPAGDTTFNLGPRITTTDLLGAAGYNLLDDIDSATDHTDWFGGTSAAAPMVTGVISLMLEAAPELGWRDVHSILSMSATHTGSAIGAAPDGYEGAAWEVNGAANWNGGGMHVSSDYGYGALDAYNAVRMAEVWHLFADAQTSSNEVTHSTGTIAANLSLPAFGTRSFGFDVADATTLESVELTMKVTHQAFNDLRITLISPDGTEAMITDGTAWITDASGGLTWTFGLETFRGEDAAGHWTVRVDDVISGIGGRLNFVELTTHGTAPAANDTYHYTDEFGEMAALPGGGRGVLSDSDGGTDWIDAAAASGDAVIRLAAGASSILGGGSVVIAAGTVIENAVSGDGDDALTGNGSANVLYGMRGDDTLAGGKGGDELAGGDGQDVFVARGRFGRDLVRDFADGVDRFDLDAGLSFGQLGLKRLDADDDGRKDDVRIDTGRGMIEVLDTAVKALDALDFLF